VSSGLAGGDLSIGRSESHTDVARRDESRLTPRLAGSHGCLHTGSRGQALSCCEVQTIVIYDRPLWYRKLIVYITDPQGVRKILRHLVKIGRHRGWIQTSCNLLSISLLAPGGEHVSSAFVGIPNIFVSRSGCSAE